MSYFFSAFWGLLCSSAIQAMLHNASLGRWGHVAVGPLVIAWTGYNSYTWFVKARTPKKDERARS